MYTPSIDREEECLTVGRDEQRRKLQKRIDELRAKHGMDQPGFEWDSAVNKPVVWRDLQKLYKLEDELRNLN